MKVLIPISGGINSTYAAWRWLSQTSHEVVSVHFKESNLPDVQIQAGEDAGIAVKDWLKANVRDFTWLSPLVVDPIADERLPIRNGVTIEESKGNVSLLLNRRNKIVTVAKDNSCDGIVSGYSLENTSTDRIWDVREHSSKVSWTGKNFYGSTEDIEFESPDPFPSRTDTGTFLESLSGRYEQYEALPSALRDLVYKGNFKDDIDICWRRGTWDAYEKFSGTGAEFDQWMAEKTLAGKWRPNVFDASKVEGDGYFYRNNPHTWLKALRDGGYNF